MIELDLIVGYINILGLILILLIVNKQIVGASLYNIFNPILMAWLLYYGLLPRWSFAILLGVLYLTQRLVNFFVKKIYWSQILRYILTTWLTILIFLWIHLFSLSLGESSPLLVIPSSENFLELITYLIIFIMVVSKIFSFNNSKASKNRRLYVLWFFLLSLIILRIIWSESLLNLLSWNIRLIIGITLLMTLLWVYNGLQIKEMVRFRWLLRKSLMTNKYKK